jgi:hypothetical protein
VGLWLVTAIPYWLLTGGPLEVSAWALWLCLVAGVIVFYLTDGLPQRTPEVKVVVVLLATFIRAGAVLGGGAIVYYQMSVIHENGFAFVGWLIVFYLVTLAVETGLLASAASEQQQITNNGNG